MESYRSKTRTNASHVHLLPATGSYMPGTPVNSRCTRLMITLIVLFSSQVNAIDCEVSAQFTCETAGCTHAQSITETSIDWSGFYSRCDNGHCDTYEAQSGVPVSSS